MRVIYGNSAFCAGYEARGYLRISDDLKPDIALMVKGEIEPIVIKAKEYESLIVNDTDVTVLYEGPSMSIVPMHRLEEVCLTTKGESIND